MRRVAIMLSMVLMLFSACHGQSRAVAPTLAPATHITPELLHPTSPIQASPTPTSSSRDAMRAPRLTPPIPTPQPLKAATFKTPIIDRQDGRVTNLKLAAESISIATVAPGATFSFNETVGARTPERGYKKAKIFVDGEKVDEYGGGICQIATTLYNAAQDFSMEIVEYHDHDENEIPYIEDGEDATVYYGNLDLKLKNTAQRTVKFSVEIKEWEVVVKIEEI